MERSEEHEDTKHNRDCAAHGTEMAGKAGYRGIYRGTGGGKDTPAYARSGNEGISGICKCRNILRRGGAE